MRRAYESRPHISIAATAHHARSAAAAILIASGFLNGAGDRFRTDDLVLGKHALYQLSYTRSP
jgi:hypothetical protein